MAEYRLRLAHHLSFFGLRILLWISSFLPLPSLRKIGVFLSGFYRFVASRDIKRAEESLEIAFPEMPPRERRQLLVRSVRHLGTVLGEVAWLIHTTSDEIASVCDIAGEEHLREALDAGRGAVLVTGHLGNWELLNARLGVGGIPMTIAVRKVYDPRIDAIASKLRSRFGGEVIPRGGKAGRQLFAALTRNRVNGLLIDQDIRKLPGAYVPFFGRLAWTPSGAATLAIKAECPVVPAFIHRKENGRHVVEIHPPLPIPTEGSLEDRVQALTAAATTAIEDQIRRFPEQWVWMHRRWRSRPTLELPDED
ncbi:MAG: lysophospholipid acyltransferase family protein [Thermoanaerobaculales bacterium]|nr:lysophospholipid acyltransferase family protein [Thermoanaerobaculales bacterium]